MRPFEKLTRRNFLVFTGGAALWGLLPFVAHAKTLAGEAAWNAIERGEGENKILTLTGHVKKTADGVVFSRLPRHCAYCYIGHASSALKLAGANAVDGITTLQGRAQAGRFICAAI